MDSYPISNSGDGFKEQGRGEVMNDRTMGHTPQNQPDMAQPLIDLPLLLAIFRRRLKLFLGAALIVLALVAMITFQLTPKYQAHAELIIDPRESAGIDYQAAIAGLPLDNAAVDTEVEVINSRNIAEKITEKLRLNEDAEFNTALKEPSGISAFKTFLGSLFPSQIDDKLNADAEARIAWEKTVDRVMQAIDVEREGLTRVISIRFESEDPVKAADITNALVDQYLVSQLDDKFDKIKRENNYLADQLDGLRENVRLAEEAVETYRAETGLVSTDGGSLLSEQQISDLTAQLIVQKAELAEKQARLRDVKAKLDAGQSADTIGEVLSSTVIATLRGQQADLERRKSQLQTRYGARHPEMVKVQEEEDSLRSQIDLEVARIVSSLESEVSIARRKISTLEASLVDNKTELQANNVALVRLRELEREAQASREQLEFALSRFKETNQLADLTQADARIGARATIPTKAAFPNKPLNLVLGALLGAAFGAFLILLAEIFDNGLRTGDDVERTLDTPLITAVPALGMGLFGKVGDVKPQNFLVDKPLSAFAESYRTVRSSLMLGSGGQPRPRVLAVTSALSGEGKTVSTLCLGRICAMSGDRVIVIDCDIRRRILSGSLEGIDKGLTEVLRGEAPLKEVIRKDAKTAMHIIPVAAPQSDVADLFGSKAFDALLAKLKSHYDLIILDTPPVTAVADTRTIVTAADAVLLVVRWRDTPVKVARAARKVLASLPTPMVGAVLTQVNAKEQSQYGYEGSDKYYTENAKYYHN